MALDGQGRMVEFVLHVSFLFLDLRHAHFDDSLVLTHLPLNGLLVLLELKKELFLFVNFTDLLVQQWWQVRVHSQSTCADKGVLGIAYIEVVGSVTMVAAGSLGMQLLVYHRSLVCRSVHIDQFLVAFDRVLALILGHLHDVIRDSARDLGLVEVALVQLLVLLVLLLLNAVHHLHDPLSVGIVRALCDRVALCALPQNAPT